MLLMMLLLSKYLCISSHINESVRIYFKWKFVATSQLWWFVFRNAHLYYWLYVCTTYEFKGNSFSYTV